MVMEETMKPGQRRRFEEGIALTDGDLKVMLFPNCITISANNHNGMGILNTLGVIEKYTLDTNNVDLYRDGMGDIHLVEVFFTQDEKDNVSLCPNCYSMTKTYIGKCGKCKGEK